MINYSTEDIRKYLSGQLSDPEMQAMEKAALDDPFLADALEGLEVRMNQSVSLESDLADLQQRLTERIRPVKRKKRIAILFSNWQVAASVIFVVGMALITFIFINNRSQQTKIATNIVRDSESVRTKPVPEKTIPDTLKSPNISAVPELKKERSSDIAAQQTDKEKKSKAKSENFALKPHALANTENYSDNKSTEFGKDPLPVNDSLSSLAKNTFQVPVLRPIQPAAALLQGRVSGVQVSRKRNISGSYVQGFVLDSSDNPIPFVTVTLPEAKKTTSTDANGFFKMYVQNGNKANDIAIQGAGYEPFSGTLLTDSTGVNKFHLLPAPSSLNEVIVIGYSSQKDEDADHTYSSTATDKFVPPTGWDSLLNYVNTHKKMNSEDSTLRGDETLSFIVNKKGELSSFKIIKSLSPAHDAAIIQLIRSGPALKIRKGRKQTCQITVQYP